MGPRVKICGNANEPDAQLVATLAPDYMGYILWPGSKRHVTPEQIRDWAKNLPSIPRVGVFVNATPDEVKHAVETAGLFAVQLHGNENPHHYIGLAQQLWHVIKLPPAEPEIPNPKSQIPNSGNDRRENFQTLEIARVVDAVLLDTCDPTAPGGTGITSDWNTARRFVSSTKKPVFLAGGLTPANIADAIRQVNPWGVDVSSGVEERPGKKDPAKVAAFIAAARAPSAP